MDMGFGGGFMFTVIPVIVVIGFVLVFGLIIVMAVKGAVQWNKNNNSPVLTVTAKVVAKRGEVRRYHDQDHHSHSSEYYYVTFEVESGDRMELAMSGGEYGVLIEGDSGRLTFQGTRYKGFERTRTTL